MQSLKTPAGGTASAAPASSRGSALLIVLGMLSFLLISSVAFAIYMRVERMATSNYRHAVMSRQLIQLAFADARARVNEVVEDNGSTFWPIFYPQTPVERILVSLPKVKDSADNATWLEPNYPSSYIKAGFDGDSEYGAEWSRKPVKGKTELPFTPGYGPAVLDEETVRHVPPALVSRVMDARWCAQWRPIWQPKLVDNTSSTVSGLANNTVVGRYAWMVVNVSDMLDVNASGTNTVSGKRNFGSLGGADLKLDGDVGILNAAAAYKTAADVGDFKAKFLTAADLAALADYSSGLFNRKTLDWRSSVNLSTIGGMADDAAPLTVYSRFPVTPPSGLPTSVTIQDWTNNIAVPMEQLTTLAPATKWTDRMKNAMDAIGLLGGSANVAEFVAMIQDYVGPNSGTLYSGNAAKAMLLPPMKPVPMISQVWFDFGSLQSALFDPNNKIYKATGDTAPLSIPVNANQAGLGSAAQIKLQVANLFDEDWAGSPAVEVQGGWAVFWTDGGVKKLTGTAFVGTKNGVLSSVEKGTFTTVSLAYGFPNIPAITVANPVDGLKFTIDLFFRFVINGLDEVPLSEAGVSQPYNPGNDPALDVNTVSFCGERYFRTRIAFKLVRESVTDPGGNVIGVNWRAVPDTTGSGVWAQAAGRWDCIDPRYNWFSPASMITANNSILAQQILQYFNVSGYDNTRSSIHWFFRQAGSSLANPSELMSSVWDFARNNLDKGLDVVSPSGGYSENSKQRYYAFSHSGLGRMYSPLEFGFFPRQLVAANADPGKWMSAGVDKLPFYRSIRVYPYVSSTTTATTVDYGFLQYFAESIGTRKGLIYGGAPGTVGDYLRDIQFNGLPPSISEVGKTEVTVAAYPELETARLKVMDWLANLADNRFKDIVANVSDAANGKGLRELYYSDIPVASVPPTVSGGATLGIFREIEEIKKLPEVKRKLLAALTQCGASRRQQLFLYILRADAYKPIIGDSLSDGSSSASCRAVALVWRDPFVKGAETVSGTATGLYRKEWFRGTSVTGGGMGGSTSTTTPEHAERLIYFQILD